MLKTIHVLTTQLYKKRIFSYRTVFEKFFYRIILTTKYIQSDLKKRLLKCISRHLTPSTLLERIMYVCMRLVHVYLHTKRINRPGLRAKSISTSFQ